jgi:hypothetical protein
VEAVDPAGEVFGDVDLDPLVAYQRPPVAGGVPVPDRHVGKPEPEQL